MGDSKLLYFRHLIAWFGGDVVSRYRWPVVAVFLLNAAGLGLQALSMVLFVAYINGLETGYVVSALGGEYPVRESSGFLITTAFGVSVLLIVSAASLYYGRALAVRLARNYQEFCARRVKAILSAADNAPVHDKSADMDTTTATELVSQSPTQLGRAVIHLMSVGVPAVIMLLSLAVMLNREALFSAFVLLVLSISAPYYLRVTHRGKASSRELQASRRSFARGKSGLESSGVPDMVLEEGGEPAEGPADDDAIRRYLDAYEIRLKLAHRHTMITTVVLAIVLPGMIIYFCGGAIRGVMAWSDGLFYLIPLRFFISGLNSTITHFSYINVLSPYFEKYIAYMGRIPVDQGQCAM